MSTTTTLPIAALSRPDGANPNVMDPDDAAKLTASIRRDGFTQPILVRRIGGLPGPVVHEIVDGIHRVDAALEAGLAEVPCVVVSCTAEQARALRISMNRLRGELNLSLVGAEFRALAEAGWEVAALADLGFTEAEVVALVSAGGAAEVSDEMPDGFVAPPAANPDEPAWALTIELSSRAELNRVKRRLRKLAGRGAPLSAGLLRALAEDDKAPPGRKEKAT